MSNLFSELCTPAKVYFVLDTMLLIFRIYNGTTPSTEFFNIIFILLWTYILGWICKKGYKIVSWILVLTPIFFMITYMTNSNSNKKSKNN
jgi:hypothetical protein